MTEISEFAAIYMGSVRILCNKMAWGEFTQCECSYAAQAAKAHVNARMRRNRECSCAAHTERSEVRAKRAANARMRRNLRDSLVPVHCNRVITCVCAYACMRLMLRCMLMVV